MPRRKPADWETLRAIALGLKLPHVIETTAWNNPCLKAHGKMWTWWSPHEDAAVFKMPREEREMLIEVDPDRFFVTDHYRNHNLVLVRPTALDPDWTRQHLIRTWREMAPKRVLKAYDLEHGTD